jgi:phosphate-selective porin OprO/OprP
MECAAITDAFEFERHIGLGSGVTDDSWGSSAGLFGQSAADVEAIEGYALAGRRHYAFVHRLGEDSVIHLGTSVRFRDLDNDADGKSVRYRQPPFFHFTSTRSVGTGDIADAENDVWLGGDAALVLGPFSLQGEAAHTGLQRDDATDATRLSGGYLSASYSLTGELRNFDAEEDAFERVELNHPVVEGGPGAWQIGARLDYIDLNDGGAAIRGRAPYSAIAGVNWHFSNYVRIMLDYALTRVFNARNTPAAVDGSSNVIHGVGARAQVDF